MPAPLNKTAAEDECRVTERERVCARFSAEGPCAAGTLRKQSKQLNLGFICSSSMHTLTHKHTQRHTPHKAETKGQWREEVRRQNKAPSVACCGDDASSLEGQVNLEFDARCNWSISLLFFSSFFSFHPISPPQLGKTKSWHKAIHNYRSIN